jgi:1,2-diacylglycerol 3-beta-galactosyltransferase
LNIFVGLCRPGQEEGNVPFVEESGFGKYSNNPQVIAETVTSWLESPETMVAMKSAALAAARPQATLDIASDLAEIAFSTRKRSVVGNEKVLVTVR